MRHEDDVAQLGTELNQRTILIQLLSHASTPDGLLFRTLWCPLDGVWGVVEAC